MKVKKVDATSSYLQSTCNTNALFCGENRPILVSVKAVIRYSLVKVKVDEWYCFLNVDSSFLPYHPIIGSKFCFSVAEYQSPIRQTFFHIFPYFSRKGVPFIMLQLHLIARRSFTFIP